MTIPTCEIAESRRVLDERVDLRNPVEREHVPGRDLAAAAGQQIVNRSQLGHQLHEPSRTGERPSGNFFRAGFSAGRQRTPAGRVGVFRDRNGACKRPEGDDGLRRCRVSRDDAFPARSLPGARRNGGRLRGVRRDQRRPRRAEAAAGRQPRHAAALQARVPGRRRRPPPQPGAPRRAGLRGLAVVLQHGAGAGGRSDELRAGRRAAGPHLAGPGAGLRRADADRDARRGASAGTILRPASRSAPRPAATTARSGCGRRWRSWRARWPRCTPPAPSTATSSRRTCW